MEDISVGSRDDLSLEDRKTRRQRRASSDILKSPQKAASSLFSKLSFSTELLNSKNLQPHGSNFSLNKTKNSSSHVSIGSEASSEAAISGRVSRWQISFDAVLDDPLGLVAFKTFLRKEYSDENLTFWIDCNDLEKLTESEEINEKVNFIISKYISPKCECPINLPSELIKSGVQAGECPRSDSFVRQKDHICHLMKTDSYPRFLKDGLFTKLVELELDNRQISEVEILKIEKGEELDPPKKHEKRKSTFQKLFAASQANRKSIRRRKNDSKNGSSSTLSSNQNSGSSLEIYEEEKQLIGSICHIHFSDGGSTTIAPKSGITARQLLTSVATRRGLSPGCIDWLLLNEGLNQESLSLENDSTCLSGRHIRGELRVTFRLDIVHIKRSIGIRSKIYKPVSEVLQPIMARYLPDTPMQEIIIRLAGTKLPVNLSDPVSTLKEQRVVLEIRDTFRKPKDRSRRGETSSLNGQTALEKLKRRRESLGLRKRSRSRDTGLNRLSAFEPAVPVEGSSPRPDNRLSLGGFKGQIDNQRGLLDKNDLVLPDFLRDQNRNDQNQNDEDDLDNDDLGLDDFDDDEDDDDDFDQLIGGKIPSGEEAENIFGRNAKSSSSLFSSAKSTSSLFQDLTNQERLKDSEEGLKKRSSLTKADLIDLPSPPKLKRMSPPKTSVV